MRFGIIVLTMTIEVNRHDQDPLPEPAEMAELADEFARSLPTRPLISRITDFLTRRGVETATLSDAGMRASENPNASGVLLLLRPDRLVPSKNPFAWIGRKLMGPQTRWVGVLIFDERKDWFLGIHGRNNVGELSQLAEELGIGFGAAVTVCRTNRSDRY